MEGNKKWYDEIEKFGDEIWENKDDVIFRCRKKVRYW